MRTLQFCAAWYLVTCTRYCWDSGGASRWILRNLSDDMVNIWRHWEDLRML